MPTHLVLLQLASPLWNPKKELKAVALALRMTLLEGSVESEEGIESCNPQEQLIVVIVVGGIRRRN